MSLSLPAGVRADWSPPPSPAFISHPLVEQVTDLFVPNDLRVAGGAGGARNSAEDEEVDELSEMADSQDFSVVICTGANACGKVSVRLAVLVIEFWAHQTPDVNFIECFPQTSRSYRPHVREMPGLNAYGLRRMP